VANKSTKAKFDPTLKLHEKIAVAAYSNGLVFRAFTDDILGFAPALNYTEAEMDVMLKRLRKTLDAVLQQADVWGTLS
jgi:adenosylmethionine-8-amino-7-oxononanoate aminotransferase